MFNPSLLNSVCSNPKIWCLRLPIVEHVQVCSMFKKWCSIFDYVSNSFWLWVKHAFLIKWCFFTDMGFVEHTYIHGAQKRNGLYCFLEFVREKNVFEGRLQSSIFWVNFYLFETIGSNVCLEINLVLQLCVIGIVKWPLKNEIAKLSFYKIYAMIFFIDEGEDVTMISMKEKICPFLSEKWKGISSWKLKVHTMYWFSIPLN